MIQFTMDRCPKRRALAVPARFLPALMHCGGGVASTVSPPTPHLAWSTGRPEQLTCQQMSSRPSLGSLRCCWSVTTVSATEGCQRTLWWKEDNWRKKVNLQGDVAAWQHLGRDQRKIAPLAWTSVRLRFISSAVTLLALVYPPDVITSQEDWELVIHIIYVSAC